MDYNIQKLDRRHNYYGHFDYYIKFNKLMTYHQKDTENFNKLRLWFANAYGDSVEIREWTEIKLYYENIGSKFLDDNDVPTFVNPNWSWSNCYNQDSYRIYVRSREELSWFKLAHTAK